MLVDKNDWRSQARQHGGKQAQVQPSSGQQSQYIGIPDTNHPSYDPFKSDKYPLGHYYDDAKGKKRPVRSRYLQGDDLEQLYKHSPEDLAQIQQRLVRIGILSPKHLQYGYADTATKKAFTSLIAQANNTGMRWGDYLDERVSMADQMGYDPNADASARQPLTVQLTNPDTIKADVASSGTKVLGSDLAAGDPQHYVDEIHAAETKEQTDAYNQAGASGGTVQTPPSVEDLMVKEHPDAYNVNKLGTNAEGFLGILQSSLNSPKFS